MRLNLATAGLMAVLNLRGSPLATAASTNSIVNFETAPVHPVALSPDTSRLAVCNLASSRLELFNLDAETPRLTASIPVGLDPVSARFRDQNELWVVNQISDSISVVHLDTLQIVATINTADAPADVVFAGEPERAFVTCSGVDQVQVFDPNNHSLIQSIPLDGQRPKALATSPDRKRVYAAIFESGNQTTILGAGIGPLTSFPRPTVLDFPNGPHGGANPPPNLGTNFVPGINPALPTNAAPPRVGMIVRKNTGGRWMDDNGGDWTEYVSGTNSVFSGRPRGWDLADHDLAIIDADALSVTYVSGLMNICMDVAVNPVSGRVSVVGTDALNQLRFEPVLNGIFVRVEIGQVPAQGGTAAVTDLNPHLDYTRPTIPEIERNKSVGDPRSIVWSADGSRGYVAGMGSDNLITIDSTGHRLPDSGTVELGEGPVGLGIDETRQRLYAYNRFAGTLSVVDTARETVVATIPMDDPTPEVIKAGRRHLYNTHKTSGLGQAACASCHVDARFDRLAWDLGEPGGAMKTVTLTNNNFGRFPPSPTNHFHPMKGPMVTQTLQDIMGHEPFHWRGDRDGLEQFNATFTNLQGAASALSSVELRELKGFLATITFPPNPFRRFDNSLSTNLALPGQLALGRGDRHAGQPLPNGNAQAGLNRFRQQGNSGCTHCHTLPVGVGPDLSWNGVAWRPFPVGADGQHHTALIALQRSSELPIKISQLRNLFEKTGMDLWGISSRSGFGFSHDGSVDSLTRFIQDSFDFRDDQETADMLAFLLSFTGSDLPAGSPTDPDRPPGSPGKDAAAGVGRQITIDNSDPVPLLNSMISLANSTTGRVDLVVHGTMEDIARGWFFSRTITQFRADRNGETMTPAQVQSLASTNHPLTYTLVPRGLGTRLGIDRDEDDYFDQTEIEFGSDPLDPLSLATNTAPTIVAVNDQSIPAGMPFTIPIEATDTDRPAQTLTFSLDSPVPTGAAIDPGTGIFTWKPDQSQALRSYPIAVRVADNGKPPRDTTLTFQVQVNQHPLAPPIRSVSAGSQGITLRWATVAGRTYRVQFKNVLSEAAWTDLGADAVASSDEMSITDSASGEHSERYYRVLLIE